MSSSFCIVWLFCFLPYFTYTYERRKATYTSVFLPLHSKNIIYILCILHPRSLKIIPFLITVLLPCSFNPIMIIAVITVSVPNDVWLWNEFNWLIWIYCGFGLVIVSITLTFQHLKFPLNKHFQVFIRFYVSESFQELMQFA